MRALFIANPRSGPARLRRVPIQDRLRCALAGSGVQAEVALTGARGHGTALAAQAAKEGYELVVAVGGDGTAHEVAGPLVGTDTALGMVPVGSGNGFAREFGISMTMERACRQIASGSPESVDVGDADGRIFLMAAGVGIDAHVTHLFDIEASGTRGMLPYVTITIRELLRFQPPEVDLELRGQHRQLHPYLLVACNTSRLGGGAVIAPSASPRDGELDLVYLPRISFLRALAYGARLYSGSFDTGTRVEIDRAPSLRIECASDLRGQLDGEPVDFGRGVTLSCRARALRVWSPRG